jgi:hypothetical protein
MGWWSCDDIGKHVIGDGPADIMGPAVEKVVKEYETEWGRKPTMFELYRLIDFVTGPMELNKRKK